MAREQGDELGTEVAYTHPDHEREETAYTATDRVNLEARGWVRKDKQGGRSSKPKPAPKAAAADAAAGDAKS